MSKIISPNEIQNLIILGHQGSGKTSLLESIFYINKQITKKGSIVEGNTISDYTKEEKRQKTSIYASVSSTIWKDKKYNFIDTPGFFDYLGEVAGPLRVASSAILCIDATKGVEVGSKKAWQYIQSYSLPAIIFVNKMDKENVNFEKTLEEIRDKFGKKAVPFCWPIGKQVNFEGFVNVVEKKARLYNGKDCVDAEIWTERKAQMDKLNEMIIESVANIDDTLLEKYFAGETISPEEIEKGLFKGVSQGLLVPVIVGSVEKNIGIHTLLNMIGKYLPSVADPKIEYERADQFEKYPEEIKTSAPFSAFVFKTIIDPFIGKINYVHVRSGTLKKDQLFICPTKDTKEKVNNVFYPFGKEQHEAFEVVAGDICIITKSDKLETGDSICDLSKAIVFKPVDSAKPIIFYGINIKNKNDEAKVVETLKKFALEDMSIIVNRNVETKQLVIGCLGQMHVDTILERIKNNYNIDCSSEEYKICYRETIKGTSDVEGRYVKQSGGAGQYGIIRMRFAPTDKEYEFVNDIFGGSVPTNFIPAVEKGFMESLKSGVLTGNPVVGVQGSLYDGKYHAVDSSELAFKMAASIAFKEGCKLAKPVLLEPIMSVEITVPAELIGDVMSNISKNRGTVMGIEVIDEEQLVTCEMPQAEFSKCYIELKTLTQAQAKFTSTFLKYSEVPNTIAEKVIASYQKALQEA